MYNIIIKDLTLSTTHYILEKKKRNDEGKVLNKRTLEYVAISYVAMSIMVLFINIPTKIYLCIKKPSWFNKKIALKGDKFRSGDIATTINWIFRPFHWNKRFKKLDFSPFSFNKYPEEFFLFINIQIKIF